MRVHATLAHFLVGRIVQQGHFGKFLDPLPVLGRNIQQRTQGQYRQRIGKTARQVALARCQHRGKKFACILAHHRLQPCDLLG